MMRRKESRLSLWLAPGAGGSAGQSVLGLRPLGTHLARCGCGNYGGGSTAREQQRATRRGAAVPIASPPGTWSWLQSVPMVEVVLMRAVARVVAARAVLAARAVAARAVAGVAAPWAAQ